jgi:hypothetical protein
MHSKGLCVPGTRRGNDPTSAQIHRPAGSAGTCVLALDNDNPMLCRAAARVHPEDYRVRLLRLPISLFAKSNCQARYPASLTGSAPRPHKLNPGQPQIVGGFGRGNAALIEEPQNRSLKSVAAKALLGAFIDGRCC